MPCARLIEQAAGLLPTQFIPHDTRWQGRAEGVTTGWPGSIPLFVFTLWYTPGKPGRQLLDATAYSEHTDKNPSFIFSPIEQKPIPLQFSGYSASTNIKQPI
jgi:hypothetical protein